MKDGKNENEVLRYHRMHVKVESDIELLKEMMVVVGSLRPTAGHLSPIIIIIILSWEVGI